MRSAGGPRGHGPARPGRRPSAPGAPRRVERTGRRSTARGSRRWPRSAARRRRSGLGRLWRRGGREGRMRGWSRGSSGVGPPFCGARTSGRARSAAVQYASTGGPCGKAPPPRLSWKCGGAMRPLLFCSAVRPMPAAGRLLCAVHGLIADAAPHPAAAGRKSFGSGLNDARSAARSSRSTRSMICALRRTFRGRLCEAAERVLVAASGVETSHRTRATSSLSTLRNQSENFF